MKKLLAVLTSISILGPSSLAMMAITSQTSVRPQNKIYNIDSFKNIVKIVNWNSEHNDFINSDYMDRYLDGLPPNFYQNAVNSEQWNKGSVLVWNTIPRNDTRIIKSYENIYTNNTSSKQVSKTQSRTETVVEKHQFSMELNEKICTNIGNKITGKISIPLGGIEDTVSFTFGEETGTEKKWSDSKTTSIEETIPSQEINQNPYTILHVKYLVTQGTTDYDGISQFKMFDLTSKIIRIPTFYFASNENPSGMIWDNYSIKDILKILKEEGYSNQLLAKKKDQYSLISVDDLDNPKTAILNLPIKWNSQTSGINLEYYEEPIQKL